MSPSDCKYIAYVGCYTTPRQADPFLSIGGIPHDESIVGTGILALEISDGKLTLLSQRPILSIINPSYLGIVGTDDNPKQILFTVSELETDATVLAYEIATEDPTKLSQIGKALSSGGAYPCHVAQVKPIDEMKDSLYIVVTNYGLDEDSAAISMYRIDSSNKTFSLVQTISYTGVKGSCADKDRQLGPHMHSCAGIPGEIFIADLGSDAIVRFSISDTGMKEIGRLAVPSGSGPRSLAFSPQDQQLAVVSLEMAAQILLIQRNETGDLEALGDPVSIIPSDWPNDPSMIPFNEGKWGSDVIWSKDGKYVYAAARLINSICIFELKRNERPILSFVNRVDTRGITPRNLAITSGGEFLMICHQHSHDVSCFKIDETTGMLDYVDKIEVPLASCIKVL